jgi:predicted DNA-binding antitoxin AbrB/MazE fold protein
MVGPHAVVIRSYDVANGGGAMLKTIHAVYEGGVFRPTEAVNLPEHTSVRVQVEGSELPGSDIPSLEDVYALLRMRFESGEGDLAERHNEHRP